MVEKDEGEKTVRAGSKEESHETLFENDFVRVMKVRMEPKLKTPESFHYSQVVYVLNPSTIRLNMPNDKSFELRYKKNEVRWVEEGSYGEENVGDKIYRSIVVELK